MNKLFLVFLLGASSMFAYSSSDDKVNSDTYKNVKHLYEREIIDELESEYASWSFTFDPLASNKNYKKLDFGYAFSQHFVGYIRYLETTVDDIERLGLGFGLQIYLKKAYDGFYMDLFYNPLHAGETFYFNNTYWTYDSTTIYKGVAVGYSYKISAIVISLEAGYYSKNVNDSFVNYVDPKIVFTETSTNFGWSLEVGLAL